LFLIATELRIKVLAVRTGTHSGAEDRLDHEAMMWLERRAVGGAEGGAEFVGGGGQVLGYGERSEFKAAA
jgi:hypothetical protein